MSQVWHDLLFAHWPVPLQQLQKLVPPKLKIDTYDGEAWIGVIPFRISDIKFRGFSAMPWVSAFTELNVRTYVKFNGKPGVYFFSLDADSRFNVKVARLWYHLPYFYSRMLIERDGETVLFSSRRENAEFRGRYQPLGQTFRAERGSLAHWLTERYCLFAEDAHQNIVCGEIHHRPWLLQNAEAAIEVNTMTQPLAIRLPDSPPVLHFARRIEVLFWPPKKANRLSHQPNEPVDDVEGRSGPGKPAGVGLHGRETGLVVEEPVNLVSKHG